MCFLPCYGYIITHINQFCKNKFRARFAENSARPPKNRFGFCNKLLRQKKTKRQSPGILSTSLWEPVAMHRTATRREEPPEPAPGSERAEPVTWRSRFWEISQHARQIILLYSTAGGIPLRNFPVPPARTIVPDGSIGGSVNSELRKTVVQSVNSVQQAELFGAKKQRGKILSVLCYYSSSV